MSCNSCTTKHKKKCGSGSCSTLGCGGGKLNVFDWLANVQFLGGQEHFDCVEVRFKNSRKEYFKNAENLPLQMGDVVATEATSGYDVGVVTLTGELVRIQMKKRKIDWENNTIPKVYRKASQRDIDVWQEVRSKEIKVQKQSRELAIALGLEMKISDVEFQGDGSKATFYYTAEGRVDFRQLIKDLARAFSVRIEMRQIGFRQEASRLGGIGSCGRELCCSTWLTDFRTVTTSAARYQQLSLNPQKLAGQCGKLKCCLNFELDSYMDALQDFPKTETKLITEKGKASCQKIDIFKRLMWFTYDEEPSNWYKMSVDSVKKMIAINQNNRKIKSLEDYAIVTTGSVSETTSYQGEIRDLTQEEDSITRFDRPKERKNRKKENKNNQKSSDKSNNHANSIQKSTNAVQKSDNQTGKSNKNNQNQSKKRDVRPQRKENKNVNQTQINAPKHTAPIPSEVSNTNKKDLTNNNPKKLKEPKNQTFKKKPNHNKNSTTKEK